MGSMNKAIYVSKPDQIPTVEHWAIIQGTSVTIPGDERSRTNPGHGYPEHTDHYIQYRAYVDKADFDAAVTDEGKSRWSSPFRVIHVLPLVVKTKVTTEVSK